MSVVNTILISSVTICRVPADQPPRRPTRSAAVDIGYPTAVTRDGGYLRAPYTATSEPCYRVAVVRRQQLARTLRSSSPLPPPSSPFEFRVSRLYYYYYYLERHDVIVAVVRLKSASRTSVFRISSDGRRRRSEFEIIA